MRRATEIHEFAVLADVVRSSSARRPSLGGDVLPKDERLLIGSANRSLPLCNERLDSGVSGRPERFRWRPRQPRSQPSSSLYRLSRYGEAASSSTWT